MLDKEEFEPYAPEMVGDTARINHKSGSCSGFSKSIIITRKGDDSISAKCFRCGEVGYVAGKYSGFKGIQNYNRYKSVPVQPKVIEFPKDITFKFKDFPNKAKVFLAKCKISIADCDEHKIGWSKFYESVIYPCRRDGNLMGIQYRYFGEGSSTPKYRTTKDKETQLWQFIPYHKVTDSVVIVEDVLSGIRCSKFDNSFVLYGTELHDSALNFLTSLDKKCTIFLDDDNTTVKKKAIRIQDRLRMVGLTANIFHSQGNDPKHYSEKELHEIIGGF